MRFEELPPYGAIGARLAHSRKLDGRRIAKGARIDAALAQRLQSAGVNAVLVAIDEPGDLDEDRAAARLAHAFAGDGIRVGRATTGRANLYAERAGLCVFSRDAVIAINRVDPGITLATLAEHQMVLPGRMLATVKIIPYAVSEALLDHACEQAQPARVAAMHARRAVLVQTRLPHLAEVVLDKTRRVTVDRLIARGAALVEEIRCDHEAVAVTDVLSRAARIPADWIFLVGASAIADRRDVIPRAIEAAGGEIRRFGLAMDPGNLLLLGTLDDREVVGLPGCARSSRDNGFDRILDRLACDEPLDRDWLDALAIGGLLDDTAERGLARRNIEKRRAAASSGASAVGVIVLAAGRSTRMGDANKLLLSLSDAPGVGLVRRAVATALAVGFTSATPRVVVVTGHQHAEVVRALDGLAVEIVHNPLARTGMAGSLVRGLVALIGSESEADEPIDAVLVCLGDMPRVRPTTLEALVEARRAHPEQSLFVPTSSGRRGNPVLIGREWFDAVLALEGDVGARAILRDNPEAVRPVPVEDDGILFDIDTPDDIV